MLFQKGHTPINKGKKLPHLTGVSSNHWKGGKHKKICIFCGKEFEVDRYRKDSAKFCSIACRAKYSIGEIGHNWKGGITPENHKERTSLEYELWRKSCLTRDNFTCQKTGISGGELDIHHINNFAEFPELRFSIDNGITLSKKSHIEFHKKYGYKNNTMEQLNEFLTVA